MSEHTDNNTANNNNNQNGEEEEQQVVVNEMEDNEEDWESVDDDNVDDDDNLSSSLEDNDHQHEEIPASEEGSDKPIYSTDLGCSHYPHNCMIESPCCKQWYWCRLCHDAEAFQKCKCKVEQMDRYAVQRVKCMRCQLEQSSQNITCENSNCNTQFGEFYSCAICHIYSNDPKKAIYHCNDCNICRIGKREQYVHCFTCGACMSSGHKCLPQCMHSNCPVCLENLFASTSSVHLLKCGHPLHVTCFKSMLKNRVYNCPLCQKYMVEIDTDLMDREIENSPMPPEFIKKVNILCNECLNKGESDFHVFGMKCSSCGSYNTKQIV